MSATPDFKERLKKITVRNMNVKHRRHTNWPMEKKIEVVSQFLVLGNMKIVAAATGVSYDLVREWKTQPWWAELEHEIRATQNIEMDTKLSKIVDKSLDAVLDRVENGEFFYDAKAKELKRRPAALRDVAKVSVEILSKRELLRGNATERKETTQVSVGEQLKMLAMEFAKWQRAPKEVIDLEMVEVLDVQNKGDQEGEVVEDNFLTNEVLDSDNGAGLESSDEGEQVIGSLGEGELGDNS